MNIQINKKNILQQLMTKDKDITKMVLVTLIVFLSMTLVRPSLFLSVNNFRSMSYQIPELGFYSLAMMMVMLSGGRDVSIVGIGNLSGIIAGLIMHYAYLQEFSGSVLFVYIILAVFAAILTGIICGLINGFVVAQFKISSFLVTMATGWIFSGIGIIITQGKAISQVPDEFLWIGRARFLGIPITFFILIFAIIFTAVLLNKTRFGFEVKFVGSNATASHYTGINNKMVFFKAYVYSGIMCSICGLEILARTNSAKADYALTYIFMAILCVVLAGTSPSGGFAKVSCLCLALLSLQFLSSGFNLLRLGGYFKDFTWGSLLIIVLSIDRITELYNRKISIKANKKERN